MAQPLPQLILYTRHGCHLCEEAHAVLEAARKERPFELTIIDVDSDEGLKLAHGECVPVVKINGQIRFRGKVSLVLLRRQLLPA